MTQYQQPPYGQPPPPPPYGAPPPQYGGQPPPLQYGAPPVGMVPMGPPAEVKWSGLSTGGAFKIPVIAFIGRLTEMLEDASSQYGLRIIEKYDQVQILESPVPWPWATVDISIKYSDRESSGWGYHVESAKAIGVAQQAVNLAQAKAELVGKVYEMRQSSQSYGDDATTHQPMQGDVWRFVRIVQPGQAQAFPQPQYGIPTPVVQPVQQPVAQPVAQAVVPAPVPVPMPIATFVATLDPSDTPAVRAKKLLNGRALNEWLQAALMDDTVKADQAFINSIYDQSFILGLKASNQAILGPDGKFQIIA